jgi:hypothetical protein
MRSLKDDMKQMNAQEKLDYVTGMLRVALGSVGDYSAAAVRDCMKFIRSQTRTFVVGFRPPDETYSRMKVSYDCHCELDRDPPHQVRDYFGLMGWPDEAGAEAPRGDGLREWEGCMSAGYEIDLDKLPKDVKIIRFINQW